MAIVNINNANFYYEIHGHGYPLVLIAGYSCDHLTWMPILDDLSKHFQVVLFDNRGIGQTKDNNIPISIELMAEDTILLIEHLKLIKPHIVGSSMGGTIAQTIAARYPEKINKLAILMSSVKWRTAIIRAFKTLIEMRKQNLDMNFIVDALLPWIFGEDFLQNGKNVATLKQALLNNPYPQSLEDQIRQFNALKDFDGEAYLSKIQAPTLFGYGTQDIISLPYETEYLVNKIPDTELVEFDCAHGIALEQPKLLAKTLIEFFNSGDE